MSLSLGTFKPSFPKISSTPDRQGPPPPEKKSWWSELGDKLQDWRESTGLLAGGALYLYNKKQALKLERQVRPLADVNDVVMHRPLVLCPGWNTELDKFQYMTDKLLASGKNGDDVVYLKQGKAYGDMECSLPLEQIPSNSKVFVNIWDTRKTPPDQTAPQLRENLALVQKALGPGKVDLVGYSMGGLAARKYLDEGGTGVGNFMTLGTPHQGTRFAQMAGRVIRRDIQWALKFSGLVGADLAAMEWLAAKGDKLKGLNERWPQQRAQVDNVLLVAGKHEMTPSTRWYQFNMGDGMVEADSSRLPGVETRVLTGKGFLHHGSLPHDSQVFREMQKFFGFEVLSTSTTSPAPDLSKPDPLTPYENL